MSSSSKGKAARKKVLKDSTEEQVAPLIPPLLYFPAFIVMFTLPNLLFASDLFYNRLHMMKWTASLLPLAIMGAAAGYRLLRRGAKSAGFSLDVFSVIWFVLLLYVTAQPLWTDIRSVETFYRECFFFASLWLIYVLGRTLADSRLLRLLVWGALINAALNVLFAELQLRGFDGLFFFIAPSDGGALGNTGQQNMFALWMAISGIGGIFLLLSGEPFGRKPFLNILLCLLLATVFHGLIISTSRSGIMALSAGFLVLSAFSLRNGGRRFLPRILFVILLFAGLTALNVSVNERTGAALVSKLDDAITQPLSLANRDSIWATGWTMFARSPWRGVGLGQFKWNYLDAQKDMLNRWPHFKWLYTHWAHNEFLQWMAESGVAGSLLMFLLWGWWGCALLRAFFKGSLLSPEAVWGSALAATFFFNALWTRPFHRIENAVWLALALAVTNRELLSSFSLPPERFKKMGRVLGGVICIASILGAVYLGNGIYGDIMLRKALAEKEPFAAKELFRKAYDSPMVRDKAERQITYFSVALGELSGNGDMIVDGLNALIRCVEKKPNTEDIRFLMDWAVKLEDEGLMRYMRSFLEAEPEVSAVSE